MKIANGKSIEDCYQEFLKIIGHSDTLPTAHVHGGPKEEDSISSMIMRSLPGMVFVIDLKINGYVYISENVSEIIGFTIDEFLQGGMKRAMEQFPSHHNEIIVGSIFPAMFQCFEEHSNIGDYEDIIVTYPTQLIHEDGTKRWYLHTVKGLTKDESSHPHLLLKVLSDIDDIKKDNLIDFTILKNKNGKTEILFKQTFHPRIPDPLLSERELEVLQLIGMGLTNSQIGNQLFISLGTVQTHRKNILKKTACKGTAELIRHAFAKA